MRQCRKLCGHRCRSVLISSAGFRSNAPSIDQTLLLPVYPVGATRLLPAGLPMPRVVQPETEQRQPRELYA